jgi:hypothetical protein
VGVAGKTAKRTPPAGTTYWKTVAQWRRRKKRRRRNWNDLSAAQFVLTTPKIGLEAPRDVVRGGIAMR